MGINRSHSPEAGSRLVQRAFQLKFGLKLCLLTVLGASALTALLYIATARSLGGSYVEAIYTIHDLKVRIFPLIFASSYSIFVLALITAAIAVISLLYSHKIAGPIYRLERNLELIGGGDFTVNTRFRGNDQLSALAEEINRMVRSLNHASRNVIDALERIRAAEEALQAILDRGAPEEEVKKAIEALSAGVEELKRACSPIKAREKSD